MTEAFLGAEVTLATLSHCHVEVVSVNVSAPD